MSNRTCSVDGCDRAFECRDFCAAHYRRWRLTGEPGPLLGPVRIKPNARAAECSVDGCDKRGNAGRGFCRNHRYRANSNGDPTIKRPPGNPMGDDHPLFRGDDVNYRSAHSRVKRRRGNATAQACFHCGLAARHWAVIHERANLRDAGLGLRYSGNPDDYIPLCVPCHSAYDHELIDISIGVSM